MLCLICTVAQTEEEMYEAHKARKKEKIVKEFCYDQEPQIVGEYTFFIFCYKHIL